jgi:hypothetical protein
VKYKDQNGDGVIDQNDTRPIGNTSVLRYNEPSFKASIQRVRPRLPVPGVTGRTAYFGGSVFQGFQNNGKVGPIALNRWTPETAATATYPRLSASNNLNNFQFSDYWQRDGSFIKLRSLELGYTFNPQLVSRVKLANARLFVNGTNLFLTRPDGRVCRPGSGWRIPAAAYRQRGPQTSILTQHLIKANT